MDTAYEIGLGRGQVAISGADTLAAQHIGLTLILGDGTYALAATSAVTLGAGYHAILYKRGTGTTTFDPAGTETIRTPTGTATTQALVQGQGMVVESDGANWNAVATVGFGVAPSTLTIVYDNAFIIEDESDTTKHLVFSVGPSGAGFTTTISVGVQTGSRTFALPVTAGDDTFAVLGLAQTFSALNTFGAGITATGGTILGKPASTAGIQLDPNAATGNFTGSLSPANLTGNRRWTFPDADLAVISGSATALTANTVTKATTGGLLANSTITDTGSLITFGSATTQATNWAQTGATTWSGGTGAMTINGNATIVSGKTLTLSDTTDSTSTSTGSEVTAGGIGVAKALWVGGLVNFASTLAIADTITSTTNSNSQKLALSALNSNTNTGASCYIQVASHDSSGYIGAFPSNYAATPGFQDRLIVGANSAAANGVGIVIGNVGQMFQVLGTSASTLASWTATGALTLSPSAAASAALTITQGTITAGTVIPLSTTVTWNAGAQTFTGWQLNATDTASAAGSLLIDLQKAGTSQFKVSKVGDVTVTGAYTSSSTTDATSTTTGSITTLGGFSYGATKTLWGGAANHTFSTANTATPATALTIGANSTSTAAAGFGSIVQFNGESTTTDDTALANITTTWVVATHASRTARQVHNVNDSGGARECLRMEASGTAPMLGFFGVGASVRPTATTTAATAVATTGATNAVPFGYTTAAQADDIVTQLNRNTARINDIATKLQTLGLLT